MLPIMVWMRNRAITLAACTAVVTLVAISSASAALTATVTNGGATSVTATTATLNGSFHVTYPDSAWAFQYGTTTQYGKLTKAQTVQPGTYAVSAQVTGLAPGTAYHFRLVVYQVTTTDSGYTPSDDLSFQTPAASTGKPPTGKPPGKKSPGYGTARLRIRSLAVHNGRIAVPLRCAGKTGSRCRGSLTVRTVGLHGQNIRCAGTSFSLRAGSSKTLHPRVRQSCVSLLSAAHKHRISGTLLATFSTHQASLSLPVTLHQ
jgi:hypothetical protein